MFEVGSVFLILGAVLVYFSLARDSVGITGNVINALLENSGSFVGSYVGLAFVLFGVVLVLMSSKGDQREPSRSSLAIFISNKALERARSDGRIANNKGLYLDEIRLIAADPFHRPQERIGEFSVSPRERAKGGLRVAWHYDRGANRLYIDDLLYHTTQRDYVDNWNKVAGNRRIKKEDYAKKGYALFSGAL